jgi:protein-disulfide isomerase
VERRRQERRAAQQRRLVFFGGAVALAIVAALVLILANRADDRGTFAAVVAAAPLESGIAAEGTIIGDPEAPVTVIEYGDYQCPGCAQFALDDQPRLIEEYVATGKIRLEFRAYSFLDRVLSLDPDGDVSAKGTGESVRAAEAALCAADQGRFWQYHDTVYRNHDGENAGAYSDARLKEMARVIGLDTAAFNTCFDERTHKGAVEALFAAAAKGGVTQTPSFAIDGKVRAYRGYDDLTAAIDSALAG